VIAMEESANLYASVGEALVHYKVDVTSGELVRRVAVTLPANVQYAWSHPSRRYLYVASSDRVRGELGAKHAITTFRIADDGALEQIGEPLALPYRPIHITLDATGEWLVATFNNAGSKRGPGAVIVYRITQGGASLKRFTTGSDIDAGIYPHQALFTRDNSNLLVCVRGHSATVDRPEDLGSLRHFHFASGALSAASQVQYEPGLGPRHLDVHPTKPFMYVSMERGNKLRMHRLDDSSAVTPQILYTTSTLADEENGKRVRQLAGPIHVHPAGTHVYVANRADGVVRYGETDVFEGGENNIAVYRLDEQTGEPRIIQHVDTRGFTPRTFALDRSGRVLVVGNQVTRYAREGVRVTTIPVSLAVFRVFPDGRLEYVRKYDLDTGKKSLFWMGLV